MTHANTSNSQAASTMNSGPSMYDALLRNIRTLTLLPAMLVLMLVGAWVHPAFISSGNLINILQQSSELSLLVLAQSMILITKRFDLSLESTVGLAPMLAAWLMISDTFMGGSGIGISPYLAIVVVILVGATVGAVNGFMIVGLKINAFILTLAMLILLRGTTMGITSGRTLFNLPHEFTYLGTARFLSVPLSVWIAGSLFLAFALILKYHRLGRAIYAIGGNEHAARVAGISVERIVFGVLVLGGILAAIAGLMLTGRIQSVVASQGQNMIFLVFASAVIGGISLNGGRGNLIGALTGVLFLGVLQNVLTLAQVAAFWIDATYGAIIIVSLVVHRITQGPTRDE